MVNTIAIPTLSPYRLELFRSHVDTNGDCWNWTGCLDKDGYGQFKVEGSVRRAHRVAYSVANGPIPDGLVIDHLCRNRACVNADHLEPVTNLENIKRGDGAGGGPGRPPATACKYGHEFTAENSMPVKNGKRCRTCHRAYHRDYQANRRLIEAAP